MYTVGVDSGKPVVGRALAEVYSDSMSPAARLAKIVFPDNHFIVHRIRYPEKEVISPALKVTKKGREFVPRSEVILKQGDQVSFWVTNNSDEPRRFTAALLGVEVTRE